MDNNLKISSFNGYFECRSMFGNYISTCNNLNYEFEVGTTVLFGDINSAAWAVSYTLANYKKGCADFILSGEEKFLFNEVETPLSVLKKHACYIDRQINDFKTKSINKYLEHDIKKHGITLSTTDIKKMFALDDERCNRKISQVGNEFLRSAAAINFTRGKQVFCFPWLSASQYKYYLPSINYLCKLLTSLGKIIIIPTNNISDISPEYRVYNTISN